MSLPPERGKQGLSITIKNVKPLKGVWYETRRRF
jgi:hypothetical protein